MKAIEIYAAVFVAALSILIALLSVDKLFFTRPVLPSVKAVTIREGMTAVEISKLLQREGVFVNGEILPQELEGYLFPDTYEFFTPSSLSFAVNKISGNFESKVMPLIPDGKDSKEIISVASIIQDEVVNYNDARIVAGIIWKRLATGMRLQIDAAICYVKTPPCFPITKEDLAADSRYNTYLHKGLPPGPISNPGLYAIKAALNPAETDYWYYITNPKTGRAVFAETLEEHNINVARYLK